MDWKKISQKILKVAYIVSITKTSEIQFGPEFKQSDQTIVRPMFCDEKINKFIFCKGLTRFFFSYNFVFYFSNWFFIFILFFFFLFLCIEFSLHLKFFSLLQFQVKEERKICWCYGVGSWVKNFHSIFWYRNVSLK